MDLPSEQQIPYLGEQQLRRLYRELRKKLMAASATTDEAYLWVTLLAELDARQLSPKDWIK